MLAIVFCTAAFEPSPISVMAITAPTPMITPRAVSAERILFRRKAPRAVRQVGGISDGMPRRRLRFRTVQRLGRRGYFCRGTAIWP